MSPADMLASAKESRRLAHNGCSVFAAVERCAVAYGMFTNRMMLFALN